MSPNVRDSSQPGDRHTSELVRGALLALAVIVSVVLVQDWRDPCSGQITDAIGCLTASIEQADQSAQRSAPPDPPATYQPYDEWLRENLQSDAEYCAEFPEDAVCNGTDS